MTSRVRKNVITSYSIHYTKLYDTILPLQAPQRPLRQLYGSASPARRAAESIGSPVITSYSIHYTKLYEATGEPRAVDAVVAIGVARGVETCLARGAEGIASAAELDRDLCQSSH